MKTLKKLAAAVAVTALLAGCSQQFDNEDAVVKDPDELVIWTNVDEHPNIVYLCIEGLAWWTTTRDYLNIGRLPERDAHCEEVASR